MRTSNQGTVFGDDADDRLTAHFLADGTYDDPEGRISVFGGDGADQINAIGFDLADRVARQRIKGKPGDDVLNADFNSLLYSLFDGGKSNDCIDLDLDQIRGSFAEILA